MRIEGVLLAGYTASKFLLNEKI